MKILIVDDEPHGLKEIEKCVAELIPSASIVTFGRSDEALEYGKSGAAIDVAFLDVNMPLINGVDLAKELKKYNPTLNVIFCTAHSEYMADAIRMHASGYVTKPYAKSDVKRELDNLLHPVETKMPQIFARAFGDFDLFVDGVAVSFSRAKCKELLAYLVFKRGGIASKQEIGAVLFGDEYSAQTQNYLVHIWSDLVKTLKKYGAENILVKGHNQYAVDKNAFSCDLYDYDRGLPEAINAFGGAIMAQYEWAY